MRTGVYVSGHQAVCVCIENNLFCSNLFLMMRHNVMGSLRRRGTSMTSSQTVSKKEWRYVGFWFSC